MEKYIEPKYYIEDIEEDAETYWFVALDDEDAHNILDPDFQEVDLTPTLLWCFENFNGKYNISVSLYCDFFINIYDEDDALAFKLRWL